MKVPGTAVFNYPRFNDTPSAWVEHTPFAFFLIDKLHPDVFVELGTNYGNSYFAFCQAVSDLNLSSKGFAVDTWTGDENTGSFGKEVYEHVDGINSRHFQHFSTLLKMTFDQAVSRFEDGTIDLLHIDGRHSYEAVRHDFQLWLPKMSNRGIVLFHDSNVLSPGFAVNILMDEIRDRYAIHEFKHGFGLSVVCTGTEVDEDFLSFIEQLKNEPFFTRFFEVLGKHRQLVHKIGFLLRDEAYPDDLPGSTEPEFAMLKELHQKLAAGEQEKARLVAQIDHLQVSLQCAESESIKQQKITSGIISSRSWRITAPFRRFSELLALNWKILHHQGLKTWWIYVYQYFKRRWVSTKVYRQFKVSAFNQAASLPVRQATRVPLHEQEVDIVICVHDAPEDVGRCLASLIRYTRPPYNLIIIDDGSGQETREILEDFSRDQGAILLRNEIAQGYTKAANQGMKAATGPFILLLNSDTVVGHMEWLDRLVFCANRSKKTGIVSPLSNTASWQSVPWVIQGEDWAGNALPPDISVEQMARMVAESSGMLCPEIPFLNGFCLLIKSACLKSIGYFDESAFPRGYGEENDLCLRAANSGWKLAVADDVYVYHAQSKSYSDEVRLKLSAESGDALNRKHSSIRVADGVEKCRNNLPLLGIRSRAEKYPLMLRLQQECRSLYGGKKLLFVLPVAAIGGGANVIIQEIRALRKMQIDCYIANQSEFREWFVRAYPLTDIPVIYYDGPVSLADHLGYFDAVIATTNSSVQLIRSALRHAKSGIVTGYYIQDFEPFFYPDGSAEHQDAMASYSLIPEMRCFTKTEWNRREVYSHTGINPGTAAPSIDLDTFRPVSDKHFKGKLVVVAMIRPETPYRAPELTMEVLRTIKAKYTGDVEIFTFGCNPAADIIRRNRKLFRFRHFGILSPEQLASLFNTTHVFIDMSLFQAMGLTGMEAMACANAVILPKTGGAESFISHEKNGFLADTSNLNDCLNYFERLANDRNYLYNVACQAAGDICLHSPAYSAHNILKCLFQSGNV